MITEQQALEDMRGDERQQVEFKESFIKTGVLAECIAAFAHAEGGTIYLGVAEKPKPPHASGKIREVSKEHYDSIREAAHDILAPPVEGVEANEITVSGRKILAVAVQASSRAHQHANGRYLIRRGSRNVPVKGEALVRFLAGRGQFTFDDQAARGASIEHLDPERVGWYLRLAAKERRIATDPGLPLQQNLQQLGAIIQDAGQWVPNIAGLLFFGYDPQHFIPQSAVRGARFQGTSRLNFIDRIDCQGTLPQMIDEAEGFVRRNTRIAAKIVGFERREIAEYPYSAVREAIANAVAHREYWRPGTAVEVAIYADRIEVQSPGRLPPPLTVDTLGSEHVLRNQLVAELLFSIGYIERWNTGIRRMREGMRRHGLEEPRFEEVGQTFRVTFYGPGESISDLIPEEGVTDLLDLGLNERQIEALRLMVSERQEMTNRRYREMFGITDRTALRDLNSLMEVGQIRRIGQRRHAHYVAL